MAIEVLDAIVHKGTPVPRAVHHDLESFLWVIMYAVYKQTCAANPRNSPLQEEFDRCFGQGELRAVVYGHNLAMRDRPELEKCLQGSLKSLLYVASELLNSQNPRKMVPPEELEGYRSLLSFTHKPAAPRENITYKNLYEMLDVALRIARDLEANKVSK